MDKELEIIRKELLLKNEEKKKKKDKDKDKDKEKAKSKDQDKDESSTLGADKNDTETVKVEKSTEPAPMKEFQLHRDFFNMRLQKNREKQIAKRNMERLKNPSSFFPSVPKGGPL